MRRDRKVSNLMVPVDGKTKIGYWFWNLVNHLVIAKHFRKFEVVGFENIPANGPFILVANHSSRWDGLVIQRILNRRANYMVSPNEMHGLQGAAVMSVGAFPSHPKLDPIGFAERQILSGEPVVVFPEGNVFYDGTIHKFKLGVARIASSVAEKGRELAIVPVYIDYSFDRGHFVKVVIGSPIWTSEFANRFQPQSRDGQVELTERMFNTVVALKDGNAERLSSPNEHQPESLRCSA